MHYKTNNILQTFLVDAKSNKMNVIFESNESDYLFAISKNYQGVASENGWGAVKDYLLRSPNGQEKATFLLNQIILDTLLSFNRAKYASGKFASPS